MFKNVKYLLASLFVICAITACGGGGGGGSSPGGVNNPQESNPIESGTIESQPDNNPPSPATAVNITSSGFSSANNKVIAGQTFQITATVTSGGSATVNFANESTTLSTVTYSPSSCQASLSKPCSTVVTVGLTTPATTTTNYVTTISTSTSGAVLSTKNISFAVSTPKLIVSKQPNPATIGIKGATAVGFTIESGSIPSGTGQITATLGSYPLIGALKLNPESCTISYTQGKIVPSANNDCQSVNVTGESAGTNSIIALARGFINASSNSIEVAESGNLPYVLVTTSLPQLSYSVAAGQEFKLTATSYNGAAAQVSFANAGSTPTSISNNNSTCQLVANGSCTTLVTVALGTAPVLLTNGYAIDIGFTNTTQILANQEIKFGVYTPMLVFNRLSGSDIGTLLSGKSINRQIVIESTSIPAETGSISIAVKQSNPGIVTNQNDFSSCKISYADNQITSNNCQTVVTGVNPGNTTMIASAEYFESTSEPITVTPYLVYVAESGSNTISMYSSYSGILSKLNKSAQNQYAPSAVTRDVSGQFLYALNKGESSISMYSIESATGDLNRLSPFLALTESQPSAIAANPISINSNYYVYVTNYASNSLIVYTENTTTGQLTAVNKYPTGTAPVAIVVDPIGKSVYVANAGSNNISAFTINSDGSLTALSATSLPSNSGLPTAMAIANQQVSLRYLYVTTTSGKVIPYGITNGLAGGLPLNQLTITDNIYASSAITIDPAGSFAYVTSSSSSTVTTYSISVQNGGTFNGGLLSLVSTVTTGVSASPWSLMLDPAGQYAYVTNTGSNNLSMFGVNSATGTLTPLSTPTVGTGVSPMGMGYGN